MRMFLGNLLAFIIGIIPGIFVDFNAVFSDGNGSIAERATTYVLVVFVYGILGGLFGFVVPKPSWRWGLWIGAPGVLILAAYSFQETQIIGRNLTYMALTLAAACLAAYAGARWKLRGQMK